MTEVSHQWILVDGSGFLFRAFHALPPLTTRDGHPTGAIRGMVTMLMKLEQRYPQSNIVVVFDAKGKSFRHTLYPQYKAHRPPMDANLKIQIESVHRVVSTLGFPMLCESGVEADDVIATLAYELTTVDIPVIIVSSDKDLAQLVNSRITLFDGVKEQTLDVAGVIARYGVPPEQIVDLLTLMGDKSDNVPGVDKVGPKTAVKWLQQHGSLDAIIAHADDIRGKVGENLREALERLPLSRQLVTLRCDVPLPPLARLQERRRDKDALIALFHEFEFTTLLSNVEEDSTANASIIAQKASYHTLLTVSALEQLCQNLSRTKRFAFDLETTSLDSLHARIVGLAFAYDAENAYYLPVDHRYLDAPQQLSLNIVLDALNPLFTDPAVTLVMQNAKYDLHVLANYDIHPRAQIIDTMLASYVCDATVRHDLDALATRYLHRSTIAYSEITGKGAKQIPFHQVAIDRATDYAAEDADITWQLNQYFAKQLTTTPRLQNVLEEIELPLIPVLIHVERNGAYVDAELLRQQSAEITARMKVLENQIHALAGAPFNLNSTQQLQTILYDKLGLPVRKKTPKGAPSTNEDVLQSLAGLHQLPAQLLEYRGLSKLKNTYTDRLPQQINQQSGRVHTSFHQAVTSTGRLSSSDPNLQNIPIRTAEGRRIRQAFRAPEGCRIVSCDYSQIELRIMAHLSQDVALIRAFETELDIHQATAAEVFGVALSAVTSEQRRRAKAINFGLIYGISAFGLARQLHIGRGEAQQYMDLYFARYPGVYDYMEQIRDQAHKQGFVETIYGRRLYLAQINARTQHLRMGAERLAINAPMQGSAADIIKLAMIRVHTWLEKTHFPARMILQVHDELVFEVAEDRVTEFSTTVAAQMSESAQLRVSLQVSTGIGDSWDAAH